jgi:hypothetical protein
MEIKHIIMIFLIVCVIFGLIGIRMEQLSIEKKNICIDKGYEDYYFNVNYDKTVCIKNTPEGEIKEMVLTDG